MMLLAFSSLLAAAMPVRGTPPKLPAGPIPDGLGVNIHFTDPQKGEMEMMAAGGFTWVRMDYDWNQVEYEKGKYRFDAYDRLMAALEAHRMRPIFILDYVHRFYDDAQSPHSDEAIEAFARFAAASAKHFSGRGILWEMYNEPNIFPFWRPRPNVNDYIRLATAVGRAIRTAAPGEAYIGPATSTIDFAFLEACFKAGLLEYWDAVSVHPYRSAPPETVIPEYRRLRGMIRKSAPKGKNIPIISGEWGYSSVWGGMDPETQGKMLARQWLTNIVSGVPLSIWYDWHDDGPDPREPEHHFGTVLHPYKADASPVYDPKPAYLAAQTLASYLRGYRLSKRLVVGGNEHFVLVFRKGKDVRLAAWTTVPGGAEVLIPASPGRFEGTNHLGHAVGTLVATAQGLRVRLTDSPLYLRPLAPNTVLSLAAAWETLPLDTAVPYRPTLALRATLTNVTGRTVRIDDGTSTVTLTPGQRCLVSRTIKLERTAAPMPAQLSFRVDGSAPVVQETAVVITNPLDLLILPPHGNRVSMILRNPSGEAFGGTVVLTTASEDGVSSRLQIPVRLDHGTTEVVLRGALEQRLAVSTVGGELRDARGTMQIKLRPRTFRPVLEKLQAAAGTLQASLQLIPDGDARVHSDQTLAETTPPEGAPEPGMATLCLTYRYDEGWKFVRVAPALDVSRSIPDRPTALGLWIYGDGKGNIPRVRFVDATNQTFQPDGEAITWKGWRYVEFPMDGTRAGRWGGANDGIVHYPIRWDTLFLLDSAGGRATSGEVWFAGLTFIYD